MYRKSDPALDNQLYKMASAKFIRGISNAVADVCE